MHPYAKLYSLWLSNPWSIYKRFQMYFVLYCKCKFIFILCICNYSLSMCFLYFIFLGKCAIWPNLSQLKHVLALYHEHRLDILFWINTIVASSFGDFFSLRFDISSVKCIIMYFIVDSIIGIIFEAVIKYSYEAKELLSKAITMSSSRRVKHMSWSTSVFTLLTLYYKLFP